MNRKISFKFKVLIPILLIFIISAIFIAYVNYRILNATVKVKTDSNLEMFINNIYTQIDHLDIILDTTKQTLNEKNIAIAKTVAYILERSGRRMTSGEIQNLADPLDIIELNIADREGNLINSNIPGFIGDDYKTSETTIGYMLLADGTVKERVEEPRASILPDLSHGEITHFAAVSLSGGGFVQLGFNAEVIGRLHEQINIGKTIKETKIGKYGYGFVVTDGIITAHPDDNYLNKDVSNEKWYAEINSGDGFKWITIGNKKYYAGYKNTDKYTVVGLVARIDYYQEMDKALSETVRLITFSIVLMIIVTFFALRKLLMPVKHLVKGLGKIADGNLDAGIEGGYNDEFDEIKDAVNSMTRKLKKHMNIISGIEYAAKIQKNLLPPDSALAESFEDYGCIWKPKDIVGGDIYWMKSFSDGVVLCACDCTGHGTPGALLTMLVVSAFETAVTLQDHKDTSRIIWELEKRLVSELNVNKNGTERGLTINNGCDLAVIFAAKNGSVSVSAGNTSIFVCDGKNVTRIRGQKIRIGDGEIKRKEDIEVINIPSNPDNKFYIATDGLYEQIGSEKEDEKALPFGYERLKKIILENHAGRQKEITEKIWNEFEEYRGRNARRDDFQLISFKPKIHDGGGK